MRRTVFAFLLLCICNCIIFAQAKITAEEYSVYSGVLREVQKENLEFNKAEFSFLILETMLKPEYIGQYKAKRFRGMVKDLKSKADTSVKLDKLIPTKYQYQITNKSKIDELLNIGSKKLEELNANSEGKKSRWSGFEQEIVWKPFHKYFPDINGYHQFSRVGFSPSRKSALDFTKRNGIWGGESFRYLFKKVKGEWKLYSVDGRGWVS